MLTTRTRFLLVSGVLLFLGETPLGAGTTPAAPFSQWPAPPASAIVPNANQQIDLLLPRAGQQYSSIDHLRVAYRTGDGVPAELYVDGLRVRNRSDIALCRYALGTHKVRVNPLMHPEKAKEVSFEVVPYVSLKDTPDAVEIALDMDPFSAFHLDTGSLKLVSVNGQTLPADQVVPASQPLGPPGASTTSPWLYGVKAVFPKQKLQTKSKPLSVKSASVQGYVEEPRTGSGGTQFTAGTMTASQKSQSTIPDKLGFELTWGRQGSPSSPDDPLAQPLGLAVDASENVYVVDAGADRIKEYAINGNFIKSWGHAGLTAGGFDSPVGIALSPDGGTAYVTDASRQKVLKFATADGSFLGEWGDMSVFNGPKGIAVDGSGNVYVVDSGNAQVLKFDSSGAPLAVIGSPGAGNGQFTSPYAIAIASSGEIYVSDIAVNTIQKFDAGGNFLIAWGATGTDPGQFRSPRGLLVTRNGADVIVVDSDNARLQAFDTGGNFISQAGSFGSGQGQFSSPEGIATDSYSRIFITDTGNQRAQSFSSDGTFLNQFGPVPVPPDPNTGGGLFQTPVRIAQDGQGHLYVADRDNHRIQKFDTQGNFLLGFGGQGSADGQLQTPTDVAVSPDGNTVYVDDSGNGRIQAFDSNGAFLRQWPVAGIDTSSDNGDNGLAVDGQGFVYVMTLGPAIQKFDAGGIFVQSIGSYGTGPGQFNFLLDLAVDRAAGRLYALDASQGLQVFDLHGNFLDTFLSASDMPRVTLGVAVDSQHSVYLTAAGGFRKYAPDKTLIATWSNIGSQPGAFYGVSGIAVDPDLKLYATDQSLNRVSKFRQGFAMLPTAVVGPDQTVPAYLPATLDGSASHDNGLGAIVSWVWHFSDGSPDQSGTVVQHRFYQPGIYAAALTVTDDDGNTDSASARITVISGLTAVISASTLQATVGQAVDFDGTASSDLLGAITSYAWTFGDGGSASGATPGYAFGAQGTYQVTLTVTDSNNLTNTASVTVKVASRIPALLQALDQLIAGTNSTSVEKKLLNDLKKVLLDEGKDDPAKALKALDKFIADIQALEASGKLDQALGDPMVRAADPIRSDFTVEADTVQATPASPSLQTGTAGRVLDQPLSVQLLDTAGKPAANVPLTFRITQGKGLLVRDWDLSTVTDKKGKAGMRFLCPTDLTVTGGGFPLSVVEVRRETQDPRTGALREQTLCAFNIQPSIPDIRALTSNAAGTVYQANAGDRYAVVLKDRQGRPLGGSDIEYRFTDADGNPLPGDHGILLPATQVTDPTGAAQAAYVAQVSTPAPQTFYIQARPLPPIKDEAGKEVGIVFPPVTVLGAYYPNWNNGLVVLPGTESAKQLLVQLRFFSNPPTVISFKTSAGNDLKVGTGKFLSKVSGPNGLTLNIQPESGPKAGVFIKTANQRSPEFVLAVPDRPVRQLPYMAVGEPECYLVEQVSGDVIPAVHVIPAPLDDLANAKQYRVEAKLPLFSSYAPPRITGGVRSLDIGRDEELPKRDEFVAPTELLDQPFTLVSRNDRYSLWRSPAFTVVKDVVFSTTKPTLPPGTLQAVALGGIQPVVQVGGSVYPEGRLLGVRKHVVRFEVVDKYEAAVPYGTNASDPHPTIKIDSISPGDVTVQGGLAQFTIKGSVYDPLADIVEGGAADIQKVTVLGNDVNVTKVPDDRPADPLHRPFAFKGRFQQQVVTTLTHGDNPIPISVVNALGNDGGASVDVRMKASFDESALPTAVSANSIYLSDRSLVLSLPPTFDSSMPDTIQAALGVDGAFQPIVETGNNTLDFVGATSDIGNLEVVFSAPPTFQSNVRDVITATVTAPSLNLDHAALNFVETDNNSLVFQLSAKRFHLVLGVLSPATADTIQLSVDTDTGAGAPVPLMETGVNTKVFTGTHPDLGAVTVGLGLYFGPNDSTQEPLLAEVTTQTPAFTRLPVSFQETGLATNEFVQSDQGFNLGGISLNPPGQASVRMALTEVTTPPGTEAGVLNPLVVRYLDLDTGGTSTTPVTIQGNTLNLMPDTRGLGFVGTKPFLGTMLPVPSGMPNLLNMKDVANTAIDFQKDALHIKVHGVVATDNVHDEVRVPRGIGTRLVLYSPSFADIPGNQPITVRATFAGSDKDTDTRISVQSVERLDPSRIRVVLTVPKDYPENTSFSLVAESGIFRHRMLEAYQAVDLRVVIVALDGGGYQAFKQSLSYSGAFSELFTQGGANSRDEVRTVYDPAMSSEIGPVLNTLPTLTFTNWATWVTGKAPNQHGILGNYFFPRDRVGEVDVGGGLIGPFACANRNGMGLKLTTLQLIALGGTYDSKDGMRGSEFGRLPELFKTNTDTIYSGRNFAVFNSQYGLPTESTPNTWTHFVDPYFPTALTDLKMLVTVTADSSISPDFRALGAKILTEHSAAAAEALDTATAEQAKWYWKTRNPAEVAKLQFLYFPGPDNRAHSEQGLPAPVSPGGSLDALISKHIHEVTDVQFAKVLDSIDKHGWHAATLFVVIADHGLIDTPTDIVTEQTTDDTDLKPSQGITKRLALIYEDQLGLKLWRGGTDDPDNSSVVHAGDGGMAQVYVQGKTGTNGDWRANPSPPSVQRLADALYAENLKSNFYQAFQNSLADLGQRGSARAFSLFLKPLGQFSENYRLFLPQGGYPAPEGNYPDPTSVQVPGALGWVEAFERLQGELNDTSLHSRSGDVVMIMNNAQGVVSVNNSDGRTGGLKGWHGSPTRTESEVPMVFSIPGESGKDDLLSRIKEAVSKAVKSDGTKTLRSKHFKGILDGILAP